MSELPDDIRASGRMNKLFAACFFAVAAMPLIIIATALFYDGVASIRDWPPLFNWLSAIVVFCLGAGAYLLVTRQRAGTDVFFRPSGFHIEIRRPLRADIRATHDWKDISMVTLSQASRSSDAVWIETKRGETTVIAMSYVAPSTEESLLRLRLSAQMAGYAFVPEKERNLIIVQRKKWRVCPQA
ncbi:MAG: hypothetical protein AAF841_04795 [Pseudomonadota bacterium]